MNKLINLKMLLLMFVVVLLSAMGIQIPVAAANHSNTLDLSSDTGTKGDLGTDGYTWDGSGAIAQLQLKDFHLTTSDQYGLVLPKKNNNKKTVITLVDGTTNSITVNTSLTPAIAIQGDYLEIKGSGTLNINVTGSTSAVGIKFDSTTGYNTTISGVTVNISVSGGSSQNAAIYGDQGGEIVVNNGGVLNADGSNSSNGVGIEVRAIQIGTMGGSGSTLGSLTAKGGSRALKTKALMPTQAGLFYEHSTSYDGSGRSPAPAQAFTQMWKDDTVHKYIKIAPESDFKNNTDSENDKDSSIKKEASFTGCNHTCEWRTEKEATDEMDGISVYVCTKCGAVTDYMVGGTGTTSAYAVFNRNSIDKISKAQAGETVSIDTQLWVSFTRQVMETIAGRRDITIELTFRVAGVDYVIIIPAEADVPTDVEYAGFEKYLAGIYGKNFD